jgi:Transposase DDE domain
MKANKSLSPAQVLGFVDKVFGDDLHAKTVLSLSDGVLGVLHGSVLAVHSIGRALAAAKGTHPKHATKQVDRLLSNEKVSLESLFSFWIRFIVAQRKKIIVALDWTEFDKDNHSTLALYAITEHGRATPLCWRTYSQSDLKGHMYQYESSLIELLHGAIPEDVEIVLLADRGFGDRDRYEHLTFLGFSYVIRFKGNILVTDKSGETRTAKDWQGESGRLVKLENAKVTGKKTEVGAVVVVQDKGMKDSWCLVCSDKSWSGTEIKELYGKRFKIEETFRDQKDPRFGMGLSATQVKDGERRDRLMFLGAIAHALLELLGAAGERAGLDKGLKTNTSKKRTLSLYNQGLFWYTALPNLPRQRLKLLMETFEQVLREQEFFCKLFGIL